MKKGYKEQDGCHNCAHVFHKHDYDNPDELYCHQDGAPRPPCMSVGMGECLGLWDEADGTKPHDERWNAWRKGRDVESYGTCEEWRLKDAGNNS